MQVLHRCSSIKCIANHHFFQKQKKFRKYIAALLTKKLQNIFLNEKAHSSLVKFVFIGSLNFLRKYLGKKSKFCLFYVSTSSFKIFTS